VRRQPFGGWKRSSIGPGAKTGGPGDVLRLVRWRPPAPLPTHDSYDEWWQRQFGAEVDASALRAERNVLRYRPLRKAICRIGPATTSAEVLLLRRASDVTGVRLEVSAPRETSSEGAVPEDEETLAARLGTSGAERLRILAPCGDALLAAAHAASITVDPTPVTGHGRVELPRWLREQAISVTMHRHGRVPAEGGTLGLP
jgi:RHH-type proline utilization regulon transcriptional repressor/proline dehydrogenase/delta 1-pyrroline-5-carboxylate dehydrogenase